MSWSPTEETSSTSSRAALGSSSSRPGLSGSPWLTAPRRRGSQGLSMRCRAHGRASRAFARSRGLRAGAEMHSA